LHGRKLFHEFIVDVWTLMEQACLRWVQTKQCVLRAYVYQGLGDTIGDLDNEEIDLRNLGRCIILPSSFSSSARNMFEIFQDFMAITCYCKYLYIFGTMIANLEWP